MTLIDDWREALDDLRWVEPLHGRDAFFFVDFRTDFDRLFLVFFGGTTWIPVHITPIPCTTLSDSFTLKIVAYHTKDARAIKILTVDNPCRVVKHQKYLLSAT